MKTQTAHTWNVQKNGECSLIEDATGNERKFNSIVEMYDWAKENMVIDPYAASVGLRPEWKTPADVRAHLMLNK